MPQTLPCPRRAVTERGEGLWAVGDGDLAESGSPPARVCEPLSALLQINSFAPVLCRRRALRAVQSGTLQNIGPGPRGWGGWVCCGHRHASGLVPSVSLVGWGSRPLAKLGIAGLP